MTIRSKWSSNALYGIIFPPINFSQIGFLFSFLQWIFLGFFRFPRRNHFFFSFFYWSFLFWTDWGSSPAVERSTLTGGNRTALITRDIYWPNGITVDYQNKRIYWIDAFHDTISSADYDGGQRTKIFEDRSLDATPYHGFDLDLFGSDVYWTDWLSNTVYGLKQTKPNATIFRNITIPTGRRTKGVMGIVTVDRSRQPTG